MSKFKVGDRVRVIDEAGGAKLGDIATVTAVQPDEDGCFYCVLDSLSFGAHGLYEHRLELLPAAPQQAGPVRTVTRREIVPGEYGNLEIFGDASAIMRDWTDPASCREAARIFNEIADVLEEQS